MKQNNILIKDTTDNQMVFDCFGGTGPQFPGGDMALMDYLKNHLKYPAGALKKRLKGIVIVQFTINKDGSLSHITTVGPKLGGGLEEEAIAVVKGMPRWVPASIKGVKVDVRYSLPIRYALK